VLGPEVFGRGVELPSEIGDPVDVEADRLGEPIGEDHVLCHATAQRRPGQLISANVAHIGSPTAVFVIEEPLGWNRGCATGNTGEPGTWGAFCMSCARNSESANK
jgi:hypothetical protein